MLLTKTIITKGSEPVTVAEVKVNARIDEDFTDLDGQIGMLIAAARLKAEHETEREYLGSTWQLDYDDWPVGEFPLAQVNTLTSVEIFDGSAWLVVGGFKLQQLPHGRQGLALDNDGDFPALPAAKGARVRVTVVAGCPENVAAWLLVMATTMLTNPAGKDVSPPSYIAHLLDRERYGR